jgi:hypothetical protein
VSLRVVPGTASAPVETRPPPHAPAGYTLLDHLGGGGMGDVYLARETASERLVAMKFLRRPGDRGALERFLVELRVLAKLNHANIVRVLAHDFLRTVPFLTMEYLPGGSLSRAQDGAVPLAPADAVRIIRTVAAAVAVAHTQNVIHRDLKPSNILLDTDGTPKVADFGLAKRLDETDGLTMTGDALGTPGYMPPEQISRKNGEIGTWSDVYGLGATLFSLLTGRAPFVGPTSAGVLHQVLTDPPQRLRALRSEVPLGLEAIVMKCLEKDPKDRYQTVAELLADLDRYEAGQKPVAPALTRWRRARQWARRQRFGFAVGAAAVVTAVGLVVAARAFAPVPPPGPPPKTKTAEEIRAEELEAIRADLLAGKSVTLVGKQGEPRWYEAPTGLITFAPNPVRTDQEPGGCYFKSSEVTLLKLLDPPIDRYRVELQIQHVAGQKLERPTLGFFVGYDGQKRPDNWTEHALLSVGFNDLDQAEIGKQPVPSKVKVTLERFAGGPGRLPSRYWCPIPPSTETEQKFAAADFLPGPWRTIVLEVSPDSVVVLWGATPGALSRLANLSADVLTATGKKFDQNVNKAKQQLRHEFAPFPGWSPRRGIGVWASGADVAIKNVVISPQ